MRFSMGSWTPVRTGLVKGTPVTPAPPGGGGAEDTGADARRETGGFRDWAHYLT